MQVGTWQQARQADTYPLGSDVQKKGPQKYRKRRKLFPFHEYGKVWNARQVIVLTSNQSLTDNAIWKVGRFQGGIQVGKILLKSTSDKISTQHTTYHICTFKKFFRYFKNAMGLECHTPIGKTLWWQCMPEIFLEGRYADLGITKSLPKKIRQDQSN